MTTMLDIYEAAGGSVNEDRTKVSIAADQLKPFEIVLRVVLTGYELDHAGGERAIFAVLLDSEFKVDRSAIGTVLHQVDYDETISLPVSQVRINKEK